MAGRADHGTFGGEIQLLKPAALKSVGSGSFRGKRAMSAEVKVHGMDGTLVEPDWPPLHRDEVRTVLHQFPAVVGSFEIVSCSPRPLSAASIVTTRSGRVFVKRHHRSVRDRAGLLEEHRFLHHLASAGAAVPRVLSAASGETVIEIGNWVYEVHETAPGVDLYGDAISWTPFRCAAHARSAGEQLARLHLAAEGFTAPRRKPQPLVASFTIFASSDPAAEMDRYLAARLSLAVHRGLKEFTAEALELLAPYHAEIASVLPDLPPLWTHNDLHCSNLFWSDGTDAAHATATIDFGLADLTNAVHDIAHAIERNVVEWLALVQNPSHPELVSIHFDHLEAMLAGYESVRPLSPAEAAALAPMTALCHAEFALSEADYFLGVLHSEERARMAYDSWLVGHARWFCGAGSRLIEALRQQPGKRGGLVPEKRSR
jgi:Ser/Thr protein kinase RdoA (MazF antagonist)